MVYYLFSNAQIAVLQCKITKKLRVLYLDYLLQFYWWLSFCLSCILCGFACDKKVKPVYFATHFAIKGVNTNFL